MSGKVPYLVATVLLLVSIYTAAVSGSTNPASATINTAAFNATYHLSPSQVTARSRQIAAIERRGQGVDFQRGRLIGVPFPKRCKDGPVKKVFKKLGVFYWPPPIVKSCDRLRCPPGYKCEPRKTRLRFVWVICFKWLYPIGIKRLCVKDELDCECIRKCKWFWCFPPRQLNRRTCNCDCQITCRSPYVLNTLSCQCKCPNRRCPRPKKFNRNKCRCECPVTRSCRHPNPVTCQCPPPCFKHCPYNKQLDRRTCRCVPFGRH